MLKASITVGSRPSWVELVLYRLGASAFKVKSGAEEKPLEILSGLRQSNHASGHFHKPLIIDVRNNNHNKKQERLYDGCTKQQF